MINVNTDLQKEKVFEKDFISFMNNVGFRKAMENVRKYGCFFAYIITDDIYKDIAKDVENRFDTSNYELDRPFPKMENNKLIE